MHDKSRLFQRVATALDAFFDRHSALLDVDANERSITHKLAESLQQVFPDMDVDCEYNRRGSSIKKILTHQDNERIQIRPDDLEAKTVYPDIVIHERRTDKNNVLVIEIKKHTHSSRASENDAWKLREFTSSRFHYRVGLYVEIDTTTRSIARIECYQEGKKVEDTIWNRLVSPAR